MEETETLAELLQSYIRLIPMSDAAFAGLIPMDPGEFSRRKTGYKGKRFEIKNAKRVLEILAEHGAITDKAKARHLLHRMKISDLPARDWRDSELLKGLKDTEEYRPDGPKEQPTLATGHRDEKTSAEDSVESQDDAPSTLRLK